MKQKPTRIVSLDYGLARIGMALSDETKMLAMPWKTIEAYKKTTHTLSCVLKEIRAIEENYGCTVEEVVIGLPLMMSGKAGHLADEVCHFVLEFEKISSIPITKWDERLTTVQAERALLETSMSRKKRSQVVDNVASVIILQNYLDFKRRSL